MHGAGGAAHHCASSIQNVHSGSGTKISAFGKTLSPSLVLMPSIWSGWKCEIRMVSMSAGLTPATFEIGVHEAGGVGDLPGGAGVDQDEL